ncbi:MAG: SNF2-related protein [Verrucomicrobiota bacterium]
MITGFHAKYFAHELTLQRACADVDRLSTSLFNATVDLNPHQIDAALFALNSPLSKGVLLADEVGLGKTIEAGLVLCQLWAERRRRLLVICPASIRKQWSLELEEKFNLPTIILDTTTYRKAQRAGNPAPFLAEGIIITSINFASAMQGDVRPVAWDLVVIDEAHKLRNAYRPSNQMGQRLRWALEERRKLLLTATPLQNSLLELFGLSTIIDDHLFGDLSSFRSQFMRQDSDLAELRNRLGGFTKRTLRNQVAEYIQYTERRAITRPFRPTDDEHKLYESVSEFLLRDDTFSIPVQQRSLTTLILRKLLASSSQAIAGTLETMKDRLQQIRDGLPAEENIAEALVTGEEMEADYLDEMLDLPNTPEVPQSADAPAEKPKPDTAKLQAEITELDRYISWARGIGVDTKSRSLLNALEIGFAEMQKMGASQKALIFTESRRTQDYLRSFLAANGYAGKIVLFNGSNTDAASKAVYEKWLATNAGIPPVATCRSRGRLTLFPVFGTNAATGRVSGSRPVDIRTAIIEHFRDHASIMIATEAAAEGVNLQFCSLVINYDLPWNPQRIEQRIGRCHRYGQKHDVVVINFLNERNDADRRVLELLAEKFNLFNGIFGASDEVLGTIESGVDFEKRILAIYQTCRTQDEIAAAFQKLQMEMDESIRARLDQTQRALLEHFDEDVHAHLKFQLDRAREQLDRVGHLFWKVTSYMLRDQAAFDDNALAFDLHSPPRADIHPGRYHLISKNHPNVAGEFLYRLSHPLGEYVLETGKQCPTPVDTVVFDLSGHPTHIAAVEFLKGQSGWLFLQKLVIESFEREEHLLFSAITDAGKSLDQETCEKFFRCEAVVQTNAAEVQAPDRLEKEAGRHAKAAIARSLETNSKVFQQERERLERWADDMVLTAEKELADTKAQIKTLNRQTRLATTVDEQHALQTQIRELEKTKRTQRQRIFDVEDDIKAKRDTLIDRLEKRLSQRVASEHLFSIRWQVV